MSPLGRQLPPNADAATFGMPVLKFGAAPPCQPCRVCTRVHPFHLLVKWWISCVNDLGICVNAMWEMG